MSEKCFAHTVGPRRVFCTKRTSPLFGLGVFVSLLDLLLASGLCAEDPFGLTVHISLMLDRNAAEMAEDVLHLGIGVAAGGTAHVVDGLQAHEDVVNHSDDDNNANRITPDDNDGDDRRLGAVVVTSELVDR